MRTNKDKRLERKPREEKSREKMITKVATAPRVMAANTISAYNQVMGELSLADVVEELSSQINGLKNGNLSRIEDSLCSQAIALDTLFHSLALKALSAPRLDLQAVILKLAMQAQRQSCQTYEALVAIKNPSSVTVVKQTNISQAVQVNNAQIDAAQKSKLENELLEHTNGKRLDFRTTPETSSNNSVLETMAKINRTA